MSAITFTAASIAERLSGKKFASGWQAHCPAHEDRNASLSISEGDDGRVLLHCHAGCSFDAITTAMGVNPGDLFPAKAEVHWPAHFSARQRGFFGFQAVAGHNDPQIG